MVLALVVRIIGEVNTRTSLFRVIGCKKCHANRPNGRMVDQRKRLDLSGLSLISRATSNSVKSTKSHLVDQIYFFDLSTKKIFHTLLRQFSPSSRSLDFMYSK